MFAMYNRAVIVAMLGKALPYLGLHAVLSPETMVISLPNAINSRRSWQGYGRSGSTVLPASVFKVFICFHRDQSVLLPKLHRHRKIANRCPQSAVAGLRGLAYAWGH